ncbi:hypothetical protein [Saccharibacillus alkalitolerans]|uniref:Uncharacterized protein n=1 Tax=Saccharibacillus alkalitolerans TaxID=2705290 RepID=A0ABX0F7B0_9BACL|nr:hypothetical protein [Saccharibacillus alkalitolerans]NGZ76198.1 hypothetical protein [Saccharibacillus alkalitolerans]
MRKKLWIPALACLLALPACSPTEWANGIILDRVVRVERYPDQQRPSVGYASGALGFTWKKGEETQLRQAWTDAPEAKSTGDPDEVSLGGNTSILVRAKTITGKSLEAIVKEDAAYEYKHKVEDVHIDAEITNGKQTLASFPYVYKGERYMGLVLAKNVGNSYVHRHLEFSPEMTDEGKMLPFVPANGSMGFGGDGDDSLDWTGGTVSDERIREIVMHFEDGVRKIPIAEDQATYLIPGEHDRDVRYIEGLDEKGKALYTWQF